MEITIAGSAFLSNGKATGLHIKAEELTVGLKDGSKTTCQFRLVASHFLLIVKEVPKDMTADEIFRLGRTIVDSIILNQVIIDGIGIEYTIDSCDMGGEIITPTPDQAPKIAALEFKKIGEIFPTIGKHENLRHSIRDFNSGLLDRESAPFYFYRSTETLAQLLTGEDNIKKAVWDEFHKKIGTTTADMATLMKFSKSHRHGSHKAFTADEHVQMMREVKTILLKTLQFLSKE